MNEAEKNANHILEKKKLRQESTRKTQSTLVCFSFEMPGSSNCCSSVGRWAPVVGVKFWLNKEKKI